MARHATAQISTRKMPKQARSNDLVAAVLDAAIQVLATEGAHRFTTARVAARAGVSVGSLYQYFPNKASILFRLQSDEWERTAGLLESILTDRDQAPLARLRSLVHAFVASECEEASIRVALGDAAPLYRDAPEARQAQSSGETVIRTFFEELLPDLEIVARERAASLVEATLTQVGKDFSEQPRTLTEIADYSDAMADMFEAYLRALGAPTP